jgi:hypothetical protein
MSTPFLNVEIGAVPALETWARLATFRGKSLQEALRKAARFAVDFAIAKVPRGDRAKIEGNLKALARDYKAVTATRKGKARSKAAETWRGTVAAKLVWVLNYKQARTNALARHPSYFTIVGQFYNGRQYARNLHKAGFKPAQRELRGPSAGERLPGYRKELQGAPGSITQDYRDDVAEILIENFASAAPVPGQAKPVGVAGLIQNLDAVLPELGVLFERFTAEDLMRMARVAGFEEN